MNWVSYKRNFFGFTMLIILFFGVGGIANLNRTNFEVSDGSVYATGSSKKREDNSVVNTFSDEAKWEIHYRNRIHFTYSEKWAGVVSLNFERKFDEVDIFYTNGDLETYSRPNGYLKEQANFDYVKANYRSWVSSKPGYTNYFLIKAGFLKSNITKIHFTAFGYNRNGDPHYHGNATIVRNHNFPNRIFLRLDQLDSAKIKDVGNGFGAGGHWTGVYWHRFQFFPSQDTIFEVRGLDKLPLKEFWGSERVFNSSQLINIFQPWRFTQQYTKVHINLDVDTQYAGFTPLLYVSNFNHQDGNFVDLGWIYDGNDDLLKRKSENKVTYIFSEQNFYSFLRSAKISDLDIEVIEISRLIRTKEIKGILEIFYASAFVSLKDSEGNWTEWNLENSAVENFITFNSY